MITYQHPDYLAFLRVIIEHPDDDAPRLALADWLDADAPRECLDPERAEFIRLQCELARHKECRHASVGVTGRSTCETCQLRGRERDLLVDRHHKIFHLPFGCESWTTQYALLYWASTEGVTRGPNLVANRHQCVFVRRGFAGAFLCPPADLLAHADALIWHPKS